eukprot:Lankesteria_metandrocarpae@DN8222_c0_g1_i1.p1
MSARHRTDVKVSGHIERPDGHIEYQVNVFDLIENENKLLYRRYREFDELHRATKTLFPQCSLLFPPKRFFGNKMPMFLKERAQELQRFLQVLLASDPDFTKTTVLRQFLEVPLLPQIEERTVSEPVLTDLEYRFERNTQIVQSAREYMIDLSLSAELVMESANHADKEAIFAEMLAGIVPTSVTISAATLLQLRRAKEGLIGSELPLITKLIPASEDEWRLLANSPSLVTLGRSSDVLEALQDIVLLTDHRRRIPVADNLRVAPFPNELDKTPNATTTGT